MNDITVHETVALDVDELHRLLGNSLTINRLAAKPPTDDELRRIGQKSFLFFKPQFQERICANERVQQLFLQESEEKLLIVAIMDVGASILTGVPLVLVSTLIVKIGFKHFCAST